jgi:hypothetical protein
MLVYLAFRDCAGNRRRSGWEAKAIEYLANGLGSMNRAENRHALPAAGRGMAPGSPKDMGYFSVTKSLWDGHPKTRKA